MIISIHAPARGATQNIDNKGTGGSISIHAPARGATVSNPAALTLVAFQSTPLREGRPQVAPGTAPKTTISIHAPARGATRRHKHS